ncbi:dual specificity protein phosphatase 22-like isoform X2 [Erpetoichthys calabaricus]|uniref:dual specificity protein phosphatase 22-like isoform X2 n=1 Tax=Erpetoichthys calabaricus TaxID=27687 RepID=UPI00109FDD0D|nr:dual specificity protein phosphatase 22-like isoform X2 [Erpetoichthys calabaricus]
MGQGMSQIVPGLYLGSCLDAKDWEQLKNNKISHILSLHQTAQPVLQDVIYLCIPLRDMPNENVMKHFQECITFIHYCLLNGGSCLVHCLQGSSRSATVIASYLMVVHGVKWQEALCHISTIRANIKPNTGFLKQLENFGKGPEKEVYQFLTERYGNSPSSDGDLVKKAMTCSCKNLQLSNTASHGPGAGHAGTVAYHANGGLCFVKTYHSGCGTEGFPASSRLRSRFLCLPAGWTPKCLR